MGDALSFGVGVPQAGSSSSCTNGSPKDPSQEAIGRLCYLDRKRRTLQGRGLPLARRGRSAGTGDAFMDRAEAEAREGAAVALDLLALG